MTRRIQAVTIPAAVVLVLTAMWQGCGDDDNNGSGSNGSGSVTIMGNVSSVTGAQAKAESPPRLFAAAGWMFASQAIAQSSCPARRVLVCVSNAPAGQAVECATVDSDSCQFSVSFDVLNEFAQGVVAFADDVNQDGQPQPGVEGVAALTNNLGRICPGSIVILNDVAIDFTAETATAASVEKNPDTCTGTPTPTGTRSVTGTPTRTRTPQPTVTGTPPTPTPTRTRTPTPNATATAIAGMTATAIATQTGTPTNTPTNTPTGTPSGTPTPYYAVASINQPPSTWLAFLIGAGALGLILPQRRRRDRRRH
jgi:hypothetical protein